MRKFAIRLLTLTMYATVLVAVPMVTPAAAATDGSTETKKKHQKMNPKSSRIEAPSSHPFPRNMSEDPDRKLRAGVIEPRRGA